jgi:hypothetical protein
MPAHETAAQALGDELINRARRKGAADFAALANQLGLPRPHATDAPRERAFWLVNCTISRQRSGKSPSLSR